jgi:inner membrane protein
VDNLCHTLVGAAIAEAGLKRRSALGAATLMIGANFPDIDVIAVPLGNSIAFRRGWTHGVLALIVLPFVLTALMLAWDRLRRRRAARARRAVVTEPAAISAAMPVVPRQLLLLSFLSILTHPLLDLMNTYGVRLLMPFSGQWFYADSLFIVDVWLWMALLAGVLLARLQRRVRPARIALMLSAAYVAAMVTSSYTTRSRVRSALLSRLGEHPHLMVAPVAVNPWRRDVVFEEGERYRFGTTSAVPGGRFVLDSASIRKGDDDPAATRAASVAAARSFLHWARFPFYEIGRDASGTTVRIVDARYAGPGTSSWASVTVRLPGAVADSTR